MNSIRATVCIVGLGPAGLSAALCFARSGIAAKTICIEAGIDAREKNCTIIAGDACRVSHPCQIITGVGGASSLCGGKISSFPAGKAISEVLGNEYLAHMGIQRALHLFREFIPLVPRELSHDIVERATTEYLQQGFMFQYYEAFLCRQADLAFGYGQMLDEIRAAGVSVHLQTEAFQVAQNGDGYRVLAQSNGTETEFITKHLLVATGRYGTGLLSSVDRALNLNGSANHIDMGIRLEFPTFIWQDINRYHNDLKLHFGNARTFCVCKDGYIAPYRHEDVFLVEGFSDISTSTGLSNLAITIRHPVSDRSEQMQFLSEIKRLLVQQTNGKPVRQLLTDFLSNKDVLLTARQSREIPSSISYWNWGNANSCFPASFAALLRERVEYFASRIFSPELYQEITVFAPEVHYYWPKFPLETGFQSRKPGLYLIGDCTGRFRGILQAFCSGQQCAESILMVEDV